ncbi:MAG: enoyl-CoA hydratase/isomerase family protein [Deltaproteobacteria bacterium]|nr:MAG: enoyl-CoA hydratase/isomerase family protein [Deltaproteobacteria bacterium]
MSYESIVVAIGDDYVADITLNRPKSLNTFTTTLARELGQALQELDEDRRVRVVIVKGAGKAFCAGIDVGDFFGKTASEYREWIECMEAPLGIISRMKKPVIAQVHGVAAANGAGLVAASDLAVVSERARLGLTAINVGLNCIGPIIPVSKSVGRKRALELLLYGELVNAQQALDMGLVNKVVPEDDLEAATREWAVLLAKKSPVAVQIAKKSFYSAADMNYYQAFDYMNEAFARLCTAEDAKEGVQAFLEKRSPVWQEK